jgi:transcriptional regulator with XRE-family HTH domain
MTTTTNTACAGLNLRRGRERAGLTRAQLAQLAGCSLASLANIEQGAVPKRSEVLERARCVINGRDPDRASQGLAQLSDHGALDAGYSE